MVQAPEAFTLSGNVDIVRNPDDSRAVDTELANEEISENTSERVRIRAEDVTVYLESNEVRTDNPISIVAETWQLNAVGLQSSIDDGKLELLSNVTGQFDVAKPE